MSRRRSVPWIHRWSRPIMGAIATIGALLTAYLTVVKFSGSSAACSAGAAGAASCNDVLASPYANIFGLPLSLFGFLGYASMAAFALAPLLIKSEQNKDLRANLEKWTWLLLFAGATAMTIFSGYLMYLLAFKIQAACLYCIASALFSLSLLVLALIGRSWEDIGQLLFTGLIVAMVTLVGTLAVYASVGESVAGGGSGTPIPLVNTTPQPPNGWEVTTTSGEAELALARHLQESGVKMYGAYWCPHCFEQKQLFGKEAAKIFPYNECAPDGTNPQTEACAQANVKVFPTWDISGEVVTGTQSLEQLADLSNYQGPRNFKYVLPGRS
ncbi:MAG: vitamin K epoxide reductase family protein [Kastovskya adunca ATA6-11-RM4]|nr:vitamin K epoxide reductase family protein [Kastovskya adunca ATA6-11-RM4]